MQKNKKNSELIQATRDGFGQGLWELGRAEPRVVALCADLTESLRMEKFAKDFPERFFQVGVAEQNLAGVAAGLALAGKIPFMGSYAVFSPGRNWDQIRVSIAYSQANVKIIGGHAGLTVGPDGATHQALEDLALMRVLPQMTVVVPADSEQARQATLALARLVGPAYLRLSRQPTPALSIKSVFKLGQAQIIYAGDQPRLTLLACGPILVNVLAAARQLAAGGLETIVINCHTIKPLDQKTLVAAAKATGRVLTIEEHQISGGLGSAVAELLAEKYPVRLKRLGVNDSFGESGQPAELLKKFHLDTDSIIEQALSLAVL
jgi:transketolase